MTFDPVLAAESVAELAATPDQVLIDDIRAGLADVFATWLVWRTGPEYPRRGTPGGKLAASFEAHVTTATDALQALPSEADLDVVIAISAPILSAAWPSTPKPAGAVSDAVDRLRVSAMTRPQLVRESRVVSSNWAAGNKP